MTQAPSLWRFLALAAGCAGVAAAVELGARFALTGSTTPRRSWALGIITLTVLGLGAPAAVAQLKAGATGRIREAVIVGFACFDVLAVLVAWRAVAGTGALGSPVVLVAVVSVAGALAAVTVRSHDALTRGAAAGTDRG